MELFIGNSFLPLCVYYGFIGIFLGSFCNLLLLNCLSFGVFCYTCRFDGFGCFPCGFITIYNCGSKCYSTSHTKQDK